MHPSTRKGLDFGRRCSFCIAEVGRKKLMVCSRCRRARYCSKVCQKEAWKLHKSTCKSVSEVRATVHPDNLRSYIDLDAALKRWTEHWKFAINRWACLGVGLAGHVDRVASHRCVVRIKRRPNPLTPAQTFIMTTAEVMSNEEFLKVLWVEIGPTREDYENYKNEKREDNWMSLVILCEGLAETHKFKLESLETPQTTPPDGAMTKAVMHRWANKFIHVIETGDASKKNSDTHILLLTKDIASLPGANIIVM